jgi:hypothetical protein
VLELIFHSHSHNCIRTSGAQVWRGSAVATVTIGILVMVWTFYLVYWLFFLGALPLEKGAIALVGYWSASYFSVKVKVLGVAFVPMVG